MMLGMYPHCALCHSDNRLNVHHNNYKNKGAETHLDLIVLCYSCHAKFHGKDHQDTEKLSPKVISIVQPLVKPEVKKEVKKEVDPDIARVERLFFYYLKRQERIKTFTDEYLDRHPFFTDVRYLQCVNTDTIPDKSFSRIWVSSLLNKLLNNALTKNNIILMDMPSPYKNRASDSKSVMGIRKTLKELFDPAFVDAKYLRKTNKVELVFKPNKFTSPLVLNALIASNLYFSWGYSESDRTNIFINLSIAMDMAMQTIYTQRLLNDRDGEITISSYNSERKRCGGENFKTLKAFFAMYGVKRLVNSRRPDGYKIEKPITFFGTK